VKLQSRKQLDYMLGGILVTILKPIVMTLGFVLRREHTTVAKGRIAVFKFIGGGSLVMAAPALHGIRVRYPEHKIVLVTTLGVRAFGESLHLFDEILCINDRSMVGLIQSSIATLWRLIGVDTIIDLEVYSRLSGVLGLATLARNRFGYYLEATFWRRGLYTHLIFFNRHYAVPFFYDRMAHLMDAQPLARDGTAGRMQLRNTPDPTHRRIAIGAGCSELAPERQLPAQGWLHFLSAQLATGETISLEFLGGAGDRTISAAIIDLVQRAHPHTACHNHCGSLSLRESLSVLQSATLFFGIDSALLHYARLSGLKSVSFWGPVSPQQRLTVWSDVDDETHYVPLPCSPCVHVAETPPCRGNNACMRCLYDKEFADARHEWMDQHEPWSGSA
jgi:ADP-heptose:LPS heptosyltransferase